MIGCGGDANPYPRGTVEAAQAARQELGAEVCRVAAELRPGRRAAAGRAAIGGAAARCRCPRARSWSRWSRAELPAAQRAADARGVGTGRAAAARTYRAPIAVWQFGDDLTLVALPGEVVSEYVPLVERRGPGSCGSPATANDDFGYLVTAKDLPKAATRPAACSRGRLLRARGGGRGRGQGPPIGREGRAEDAAVTGIGEAPPSAPNCRTQSRDRRSRRRIPSGGPAPPCRDHRSRLYVWRPWITVSRNTRARRARSSTPSGVSGRGTSGAKMFSQHSGIFRPVKATGCSSR